jgi:hypothetical protein
MRSIFFAAVVGLFASAAHAEEIPLKSESASVTTRSIPIDSIWYYGSVGEMSLRRLEPDLLVFRDTPENIKKYSSPEALKEQREKAKRSLVLKIEKALRGLPIADPKITPAPGFVVQGTGREALQGIVNVLVEKKKPEGEFSSKDELSLVFFIHPTGVGTGIESVEVEGNSINITYFLTSNSTLLSNPRLYLIPLGELPAGKYTVNMARPANEASRNQPGFPPIPAGVEKYTVCRPFDFVVSE